MPTHYTPIPSGTGITISQAVINSPLQELDDAIVGLETGTVAAANGGRLAAEGTTLTIVGNAITRTQNRHLIDTGGGADTLSTINGLVDGLILYLQIANAGNPVTIAHNTGNILLANSTDLVANSTQMIVALVGSSRLGKWVELGDGYWLAREVINATLTPLNQLILPDRVMIGSTVRQRRLALMPSPEVSNRFEVRAAAATVQPLGIAAPTVSGTATASNQSDSTYINLASGAVAGNIAGLVSATFNLTQRQHNPVLEWIMQTGAAGDIANIRFWMGLFQAAPTNVDTLAAANAAAAFRFSTVAGDAGWVGITNDGATQCPAPANTGVAVAANTRYKFRIRVDNANGLVYFSVNDSAEVSLNVNLPAAGQDLGFALYGITTAAAAKNWKFSRMWCAFS